MTGALPHTQIEPPAILIVWSNKHLAWRATAIVNATISAPAEIEGPTTSEGRHSIDALMARLDRRFGLLSDDQCAPTLVSIEAAE